MYTFIGPDQFHENEAYVFMLIINYRSLEKRIKYEIEYK